MAKRNLSFGVLAGIGAALALAGIPGGVDAQAPNARMAWQPFLGCWQADGGEEEQGVLCFVASGDRIEMVTVAGGAITHREPFSTDGQPRQIEQEGCSGSESARFSGDFRRIYTTSDMACAGQPPRRGTGIIFMPAGDEWVDVRAMEAQGEDAMVWAQWYVRTGEGELNALGIESGRYTAPLAVRGMASLAKAPITIDDVIDASENVHDKAVEAWIAEVAQEFAALDVDDLFKLDDSGVSSGIIDVVVAVSFPERFALNQRQEARVPAGYYGARPIWGDPYYSSYGLRYGSYSPGYGRYGYGGYGGYYGSYGGSYPRVIVNVTPISRTTGLGRVISGRGYSSGGSRGFVGGSSAGSSRGATGSSRGSSGSTGRTAKARGSSSSSFSPPAASRPTPVASSSSGGSSSTKRTAKARTGKSSK